MQPALLDDEVNSDLVIAINRARRRELFGAHGRDDFAELWFELAGQLAHERLLG